MDERTATTSRGGRPPEYRDRVRTSLDIERDLLARVDAEAARRDLSRAKVLNLCIARGLSRLTPVPAEVAIVAEHLGARPASTPTDGNP